MKTLSLKTMLAVAIALAAAGCGTTPMATDFQSRSTAAQGFTASRHHGWAPKPAPNPNPNPAPNGGGGAKSLTFVTIHATVSKIDPEDTNGLPHQNFEVTETQGDDVGKTLQVNNDEKFGSKVDNLTVGEALVIRGVIYRDPHDMGIHWTHHDQVANDGGFIQTPDGHVYQ